MHTVQDGPFGPKLMYGNNHVFIAKIFKTTPGTNSSILSFIPLKKIVQNKYTEMSSLSFIKLINIILLSIR